jgi:O-acetyl-ADP-ribose deacetylase (regulator of RNase III)
MKDIQYIKGDATNPLGNDNKIIVHICNDIGAWGKGFVLAILKRWKAPEKEYKDWYKSKKNFELGEVQLVQVEENLWVANMIGQHKIYEG